MRKLEDLDLFHSPDQKCVVLGNGISIKDYAHEPGTFTIGVNDICKAFVPSILLIVDEKRRFSKERAEIIENSDCIHVVYDESWNFKNGKAFSFKYGTRGEFKHFNDKNIIDTGWDSPYMACLLAAKLKFKKIDIIGVDYCDGHFYAEDGPHNLMKRFDTVNTFYKNLTDFLNSKGIEFYNISNVSKITTIPKRHAI